jgi:O-methyltransferase
MVPKNVFEANLALAEQVRGVEGCVVECGVWKGGMAAGLADVLGPARDYYLFDSFEGLPPAKDIDGEAALRWQIDKQAPGYHNNCAASMDEALATLSRSRADSVIPVKGWFQDTVPNFSLPSPVALLRLDGDWYDSTIICLNRFFPVMAKGGLVIVDDYYAWDGCSRAVHDYLSQHKLAERIEVMPPGVAYLTKRDWNLRHD